jgi:hypothetical protein
MTTPAAGWYPDPQNASMKRYWDGSAWTEQVQLASSVPPPPPPPNGQMMPTNSQMMPRKYLVESILATIFCCLPVGIPGIVFSLKVESLWNAGAYAEAQEASRKARMWSSIALGIGLSIVALQLVTFFIGLSQ